MPAFMREQKPETRPEAQLQGFHKGRPHFCAGEVQTIRGPDALSQLIL
jgi:hypothetical protein